MTQDIEKALPVVRPYPGMVITENVAFEPGTYAFPAGEGITVAKDNLIIDGNGATLIGPGQVELGPESYAGIGLSGYHRFGVTVTNLKIQGFKIGLLIDDGEGWMVDGNDFSDNYHDPDYGWGDGPSYGGLLLIRTRQTTIRKNTGRNNWNGLELRYSHGNEIADNDFSHCSNVCLKLWNASDNLISDNNFSYGLRISPGEVHARDSTSLLVESGSNNNKFFRNDFTHGGDGIFIRVLNGWISTGNYFEENDCSYANNNAVESWSPGNVYVRNIANYSSYGFWLGGSDDTVLIENQVRYNGGYNGQTPKNAPEPFGNAGIAVVHGSSSHFTMARNDIQYNMGPGVAVGFKPDYPAYHWIIQQNTIKHNKTSPKGHRGHGIYLYDAHWFHIAGNDIDENDGEPLFIESNVREVVQREASISEEPPRAHVSISEGPYQVDQGISFDASASSEPRGLPLNFRWDLGDGTYSSAAALTHSYSQPGFYRVGLTVDNGRLADLAFFNIYVTAAGEELGTEDDISNWQVISDGTGLKLDSDDVQFVQGRKSIYLFAPTGKEHGLIYPKAKSLGLGSEHLTYLSFWLKFNAEPYTDREHKRPIVRLHQDDNTYWEYRPKVAYLLERSLAPNSEDRGGWMLVSVPLRGDDSLWVRQEVGKPLRTVNYIVINIGPSEAGLSEIWLDGLLLT